MPSAANVRNRDRGCSSLREIPFDRHAGLPGLLGLLTASLMERCDRAFLPLYELCSPTVYLDRMTEFPDNSCRGYRMRLARTIVGMLVAASIALLPATAGMATPNSATIVTSSHHCCDDEDMPMQMPMGMDCQSSAGCAFKCFGLYEVSFAGPTLAASPSDQLYSALVQILDTVRTSPPLRPPRA